MRSESRNERRRARREAVSAVVFTACIMSAPNVSNVCYDTAYMANLSEVQLFYPTSILYVDGI